MSWDQATAILDCRRVMSDGPTDKLRYRKQIIGQQDSSNKTFKTFEYRRISTLAGASGSPVGIFVNNLLVSVSSEDLTSGEFNLALAPSDGESVKGTYYIQWFNDDEMIQFLVSAAQWIGVGDDYTSIGSDLRPAAKEYVAAIAYQKLVARFSENLAETYQLYDAPDEKRFNPVTAYMKISEAKMDLAFKLRDDVYENRKGQAKAPRSGTISGRVRDVPPNR